MCINITGWNLNLNYTHGKPFGNKSQWFSVCAIRSFVFIVLNKYILTELYTELFSAKKKSLTITNNQNVQFMLPLKIRLMENCY